jgi:hypothetical protein
MEWSIHVLKSKATTAAAAAAAACEVRKKKKSGKQENRRTRATKKFKLFVLGSSFPCLPSGLLSRNSCSLAGLVNESLKILYGVGV